MAALAYLLLPVTGLLAFALSHRRRVRLHGLQAIIIGTGWAVLLYAASALSAAATVLVGALGTLVWVGFLVATALGQDPRLPGLRGLLDKALDESAS